MLIYIYKNMKCNFRNVCVSDKDKEILTFEISSESDKNIVLSYCYGPSNGVSET